MERFEVVKGDEGPRGAAETIDNAGDRGVLGENPRELRPVGLRIRIDRITGRALANGKKRK